MIIKQIGNIVFVYEDDLEAIKFQVEVPERFTTDDVEGFYKHLIKMIKERENGPS